MRKFDAIIIGAGQAGVPLAKKLAKAGKKTALIEKNAIGGVCVNEGCTPTKTMIASARMAYLASRSHDLGIDIKTYKVNFKNILKRKNKIVKSFRAGAEKGIEKTPNLTLIYGEASFKDKHTILISTRYNTQEEISGAQIFINVGNTPIIPEIEGINEVEFFTSDNIMHLKKLPGHLLIIGGGYIGLEFGQMFKRFGAKVTILEMGKTLMPHEDDDVCIEMSSIFKEEGIKVLTSAELIRLKQNKNTKKVTVKIDGKEKQISCSHILIATGRKPQTAALNLESAGVKVDENGYIPVNQVLKTNVNHIYALGDVNGNSAFTHIAYNDYVIVSKNILENARLTTRYRIAPYCMFTDPQLGRVGITENQAKERGLNYKVAKIPMRNVARAIETAETRGFMKAIVDAGTKKILGASIIGEEGGEIMSVLQMAMVGNLTYEQIRYMIFAHPLYAESLNNLFMSLDKD
jgi:dihydrolipoamide dehydrogenase